MITRNCLRFQRNVLEKGGPNVKRWLLGNDLESKTTHLLIYLFVSGVSVFCRKLEIWLVAISSTTIG